MLLPTCDSSAKEFEETNFLSHKSIIAQVAESRLENVNVRMKNGFVCSHLLLSDQMLFMEPFPCRTRHSNQFNAFVMSVYLPLDRDIWNSMSKPTATRRA